MVNRLPVATFPGKNAEPQATEPLVDPQRRITANWRRWTEFVDVSLRRMITLFTFLALEDTPNSYSGQTLKLVRVKADETGLEFVAPSTATDETAQDAVGTILTDTATIDFTYNDATPSITADVKNGSITFAKMQAITDQRLLGAQGGTTVEEIAIGTGLTLAANTLSCSVTGYTDEMAQDAIGGIVTGISYNDGTPSLAVIRSVQIQVSDPAGSAITTGDGKAYYRIPALLNGYNLTAVAAALTTVSSSGIPTIQVANVTDAVDMLSTKLTIDASETDSITAATAAVIDTSKDDVATGDMLRIDIDVAGTGAKGLIVDLTFTLP